MDGYWDTLLCLYMHVCTLYEGAHCTNQKQELYFDENPFTGNLSYCLSFIVINVLS